MSAPESFRLETGGIVDRSRPLGFIFDGRALTGFAGDTLASALLANGVRLVGRSYKYHRPRGILSAGSEEPNALVELRRGARREPNTRATTAELFDGLEATSQHRWPSLGFDLMAVNGLLSPLFVAGFYYKTFKWPSAAWERLYEPVIRRAAGLGRPAGVEDPDSYEKANAFCDVLVIGGGPAGLMAALAAGRAGARVIVLESDAFVGGRMLSERDPVGGEPAPDFPRTLRAELASLPDVEVMARTSAVGLYDGPTVMALERVADHLPQPPQFVPRQRLWRIRPKRIVLATGAVERSIAFAGNDRPGVMLAGAVRTYLNRFAVAPARTMAVFTASDDGWRTAFDLVAAGVNVPVIVDPRRKAPVAELARATQAGIRVISGGEVVSVAGGRSMTGLTLRDAAGRTERIAATGLAISGGFDPALRLATHLGHVPRWEAGIAAYVPQDLPPGMVVAGAAAGVFALADALRHGAEAGMAAAVALGLTARLPEIPETVTRSAGVGAFWHVAGGRDKAFVDFQNDVTVADVELSVQEGYVSVEHLKRYTTLGMATDQGRISALTGHAVLAARTGRTMPETGTIRARPPVEPVALGALAGTARGHHFRPERLTPLHDWATRQGAVFVDAGPWKRAAWYPQAGEDWLTAVKREVTAVRTAVGFCDVSTLGKIEVQGPDAAAFLDRIYANTHSTLPVGKARYGLMLREDGMVMDDGTVARLGPEHYFVTTTTANAGRVMQHMVFCHEALWPELDVDLVSVTESWAQVALAGPRAALVLGRLIGTDPVSDAALPYLGVAELALCRGLAARLFRISFSGERAYEIAVPADQGEILVKALMKAGAEFGITPYGTEALSVMRIEKGHPAGAELNGQTTARDLGLGRLMSTRKDYIGRVLSQRPGLMDPARQALVGIRAVDPSQRLRGGGHFLPLDAAQTQANDLGHLTSAAFSPTLNRWIGLGLLSGGPARIGETIRLVDPVRATDIVVEVVTPVFLDPTGSRLHV